MLHFARWKTILIWLAVVVAFLFAFPNVLSKKEVANLPSWVPHTQMTLGLDLQGGSYILLQVDRGDIVKDRINATVDDVRRILRDKGIGYTGLGHKGQGVQVHIRNSADVDKAKQALQDLAKPVNSGVFGSGNVTEVALSEPQPDTILLALTDSGIDYRVRSAVTQSIEVVRRRVDELGTTEPLIQRQGSNRILVQVPGLGDPAAAEAPSRPDRQADLPDGRHVDAGERGREQPCAGGRRDPAIRSTIRQQQYLVERRVLVSGEDLTDAQAGFDQRTNEPIVSFRFDTQGRPALRAGHAAERRQALRHRARQQGDFRAGDPRADPRRQRADFRQLHAAKRQRSGDPAARRRTAGDAEHRRGTHRRSRASAPTRSRRAKSPASSAPSPSSSSWSSPTACSACSPTSR